MWGTFHAERFNTVSVALICTDQRLLQVIGGY